jgi:hypothetical protein
MFNSSGDETEFYLDTTGDQKNERLSYLHSILAYVNRLVHCSFYLMEKATPLMIFICMLILFFMVI